jgi:hypothetical protein
MSSFIAIISAVGPHNASPRSPRATQRIQQVPDSVFDEALSRIRKNIGGVLPPSSLVAAPSPALTTAMLAAFSQQEGRGS